MGAIKRDYTGKDVEALRGTVKIEHTLADLGSKKLRRQLKSGRLVRAAGAITGHQAVQMVRAGLKAIYCSGWQVAADGNTNLNTYPDLSLYNPNSVPNMVQRINNALMAMDRIDNSQDWIQPIIADGEAGFGGLLNVFELTKSMIEAGVSAVHYEDQLSSAKKCGHMGGKCLVPTSEFIRKLNAARLATDVLGTDTIIIARTDADAATLLTSDIDDRDTKFITSNKRTPEGFYNIKGGMESGLARGLSYAPYADLIWMETSKPDLGQAREFAKEIHRNFPGKMLAYNCSPSFNWVEADRKGVDVYLFQDKLFEMGYVYQFITLFGFHVLNYSMFERASDYNESGMEAYRGLQELEIAEEKIGYQATKHQKFVGTGYYDKITEIISGGESGLTALSGSTEEDQF